MPHLDEVLDQLDVARFYLTLELTKGYWQIPLSTVSQEKKHIFFTMFGLHHFITFLFGWSFLLIIVKGIS